ncbi:MAG: hypothetical protein QW065_04610 [Acidilobaceae archaeon]
MILNGLTGCQAVYCVVSPTAVTASFKPRGYASSAGRIDIIARCMYVLSFFSGTCFLGVLLGPPDPPKIVFDARPSYTSEREAVLSLSKALKRGRLGTLEVMSESPEKLWLKVRRFGFKFTLLKEEGENALSNPHLVEGQRLFFLGSQIDMPEHLQSFVLSLGADVISVGPMSLHTEHVIAFVEWLRRTGVRALTERL